MKMKKLISLLLSVLLVFTTLPLQLIHSSANKQNYPTAILGDKSHFLTEVSVEKSGKYAGLIKVMLSLGIESKNLNGTFKKITTFNTLIKVNAGYLSPVSSMDGMEGTPVYSLAKENAGAAPEYSWLKRDADKEYALFAKKVPHLVYDDELEEDVIESVAFDVSLSSISYNESTNQFYFNVSGTQPSGFLWTESFDAVQRTGYYPVAYFYLKPNNNATSLPALRKQITLAKEDDILSSTGCLSSGVLNETSISSMMETSRFVSDSAIAYTDVFYNEYQITFHRLKDGGENDDVTTTILEERTPEAPEVADYMIGDMLYTFREWDTPIVPAAASVTYTALYDETDLGHDYVGEVTKQPDCENKGETTYTCSRCGASYTEADIPALDHDWGDWAVTTEPDCLNEGVETRICKRDAAHIDTRPVDALGHNYVGVVTPPTCTEQGYTTYTCSRCQDSYVDDYTNALDHAWGEWVVTTEPDCLNEGVETRICQNDDTHVETRPVDALGHDYVGVVTPPTCTEQGYTTYTCSRCKDSYVADYTDALTHNWGDWVVTTEPDCLTQGEETRVCQNDSTHTETRPVDALGHDYVGVVTNPTCTEQGYTTYTCSRCQDSYVDDYTNALDHAWGDWVVTTEPDCLTQGEETRVCQNDSTHTETRPVNALGHDYVGVVTNPTCTEQGYTTYTCSRCQDSYVDDYTDALTHNWGDWVVTTEPDCLNAGEETRTCQRDDTHVETRPVDALGHNYVGVVTNPTCTEQGYTTYTCSRCQDSYVDDYTNALDHAWGEWVVTTEPDCLNEGVETRICQNDETHVETRPVEALGHNYVGVVTPPTCTEQGFTTYTCSRCQDSYLDDYTNALDHDWSEWVVTTEPDCLNGGEETRICQNDETHVETRPVDALGHNYVVKVTEPTIHAGGYTEHTCSRCQDYYKDAFTDRTPLYYNVLSLAGKTHTLVFINAETRFEVSAADGKFVVNDLPEGTYTVYATAPNCLTRLVGTHTYCETDVTAEAEVVLPVGDVNGDALIDIGDISILLAEGNFAQENSALNLVGNDLIDINDITELLNARNYGAIGVTIV